eukprot:604151-Rhodomonas_salina.5
MPGTIRAISKQGESENAESVHSGRCLGGRRVDLEIRKRNMGGPRDCPGVEASRNVGFGTSP